MYDWRPGADEVQVRPFATPLIRYVLAQQDQCLCPLGFYTTAHPEKAKKVVSTLLEQVDPTECTWHDEPKLSHAGRVIWLFDEFFTEKDPSIIHEREFPNGHACQGLRKDLSYESEKLGDRFFRSSMLYITCKGGLIDTESSDNLLEVSAWEPWKPEEDEEVRRVQQRLQELFERRPQDIRSFLNTVRG
ncbi:unnamed protein product [Durusdinium trenchii]|uniref:Uncharacterized protein n=1 Tax=Durusdinium trenchii TaxID=1381693 RepID=A0ABP0I167_9DINO